MGADAPRLYLDHNAGAPLVDEARELLERALREDVGNPSSTHGEGRAARQRLERARERIAERLDAPRDAVVFTSGGTEANALALGAAPRGSCIAALANEHPSVLRAAEARGRLQIWPVDAQGRARLREADPAAATPGSATPAPRDPTSRARWAAPDEVRDARPTLVCASLANHETGTVQDMSALRAAAHALGARLHVDACQAVGRMRVSFADLGADLLGLTAHKIGGPVGIGALLVGVEARPEPLLVGGSQEGGLRGGTESAWLAEAFAAAVDVAVTQLDEHVRRWRRLRAALLDGLDALDGGHVVNSPSDALPNTLNVSFPGRSGPALVHRLDLDGVAVSHGAACASGSALPSPVLLSQGLGERRARSSLRISFGPRHDDADIARLLHALRHALRDVRVRDA